MFHFSFVGMLLAHRNRFFVYILNKNSVSRKHVSAMLDLMELKWLDAAVVKTSRQDSNIDCSIDKTILEEENYYTWTISTANLLNACIQHYVENALCLGAYNYLPVWSCIFVVAIDNLRSELDKIIVRRDFR